MGTYPGNDNFPASISLVDDGVEDEAIAFNIGGEALADRTTWLKNRTGGYRLSSVVTNTFTALELDYSGSPSTPTTLTTTLTVVGYGPYNVAENDFMDVDFSSAVEFDYDDSSSSVLLTSLLNDSQNGGSFTLLTAARDLGIVTAAGGSLNCTLVLSGSRTISTSGPYEVQLSLSFLTANSAGKAILKNAYIITRVWSPNT